MIVPTAGPSAAMLVLHHKAKGHDGGHIFAQSVRQSAEISKDRGKTRGRLPLLVQLSTTGSGHMGNPS
jgi:hypothetical protein